MFFGGVLGDDFLSELRERSKLDDDRFDLLKSHPSCSKLFCFFFDKKKDIGSLKNINQNTKLDLMFVFEIHGFSRMFRLVIDCLLLILGLSCLKSI